MPSFDKLLVDRIEHVRRTAVRPPPEVEQSVRAAVRPDPPLPRHPMVMPLALVVVDEAPCSPVDGVYRDEWGSLPEPFRSAVATLVAAEPDGSRCWVCGSTSLGWGLDVEGDLTWLIVGLLWTPSMPEDGPVVTCEGCTPTILDGPLPEVPL